jgi:peptidoglycan/LPS O-acetylase OafA/YrhL
MAALMVMCGHVRALFFVDFHQVAHGNIALRILYFGTGLGHQAVVLFFVLSGYLISSAVFKRRALDRWSWGDYAIDRCSRLYAVLIPGLLIGWVFDRLGILSFAPPSLYSRPLEAFGSAIAQERLTLSIFFGNLAFLQTIACPTFGSNSPLWSLANEFWYYLLFPVLLEVVKAWRSKAAARATLLSLLTLAIAAFVGWPILCDFPIWLAGTALVVAHATHRLRLAAARLLYLFGTSVALCLCFIAARTNIAFVGSDLTLGLVFGAFLLALLQLGSCEIGSAYARLSHLAAGFSYSLYVLHFPFLLFLRAWLTPSERWQPDARHLVVGLGIGIITLVLAWFVSTFTEQKTSIFRDLIKSRILIERRASVQRPE